VSIQLIESLLHTYGGQSQFPFSSRIPFSPSAHSHGGGVVGGGVVPVVERAVVVPVYGVVFSVGGVVALVVPVTVVLSVVFAVVPLLVVNFVAAIVLAVGIEKYFFFAFFFSFVVRSIFVLSVVVGGGFARQSQVG